MATTTTGTGYLMARAARDKGVLGALLEIDRYQALGMYVLAEQARKTLDDLVFAWRDAATSTPMYDDMDVTAAAALASRR